MYVRVLVVRLMPIARSIAATIIDTQGATNWRSVTTKTQLGSSYILGSGSHPAFSAHKWVHVVSQFFASNFCGCPTKLHGYHFFHVGADSELYIFLQLMEIMWNENFFCFHWLGTTFLRWKCVDSYNLCNQQIFNKRKLWEDNEKSMIPELW